MNTPFLGYTANHLLKKRTLQAVKTGSIFMNGGQMHSAAGS